MHEIELPIVNPVLFLKLQTVVEGGRATEDFCSVDSIQPVRCSRCDLLVRHDMQLDSLKMCVHMPFQKQYLYARR